MEETDSWKIFGYTPKELIFCTKSKLKGLIIQLESVNTPKGKDIFYHGILLLYVDDDDKGFEMMRKALKMFNEDDDHRHSFVRIFEKYDLERRKCEDHKNFEYEKSIKSPEREQAVQLVQRLSIPLFQYRMLKLILSRLENHIKYLTEVPSEDSVMDFCVNFDKVINFRKTIKRILISEPIEVKVLLAKIFYRLFLYESMIGVIQEIFDNYGDLSSSQLNLVVGDFDILYFFKEHKERSTLSAYFFMQDSDFYVSYQNHLYSFTTPTIKYDEICVVNSSRRKFPKYSITDEVSLGSVLKYVELPENDPETVFIFPPNFKIQFVDLGDGFAVCNNPYFESDEDSMSPICNVFFKGIIAHKVEDVSKIINLGEGFLMCCTSLSYVSLIFQTEIIWKKASPSVILSNFISFRGSFLSVNGKILVWRGHEFPFTSDRYRNENDDHPFEAGFVKWADMTSGRYDLRINPFLPSIWVKFANILSSMDLFRELEDFSRCLFNMKEKNVLFYSRIYHPRANFNSFSRIYQKFVITLIHSNNTTDSYFRKISLDVLLHKILPYLSEVEIFLSEQKNAKRLLELRAMFHNREKTSDFSYNLKKEEILELTNLDNPWKVLETIYFIRSNCSTRNDQSANLKKLGISNSSDPGFEGLRLDDTSVMYICMRDFYQKTEDDSFVFHQIRLQIFKILQDLVDFSKKFLLEDLYEPITYIISNFHSKKHIRRIYDSYGHNILNFIVSCDSEKIEIWIDMVTSLILQIETLEDAKRIIGKDFSGCNASMKILEKISFFVDNSDWSEFGSKISVFYERFVRIIKSLNIIYQRQEIIFKENVNDNNETSIHCNIMFKIRGIICKISKLVPDRKGIHHIFNCTKSCNEAFNCSFPFLLHGVLEKQEGISFGRRRRRYNNFLSNPSFESFSAYVDILCEYLPNSDFLDCVEVIFDGYNVLLVGGFFESEGNVFFSLIYPSLKRFLERIQMVENSKKYMKMFFSNETSSRLSNRSNRPNKFFTLLLNPFNVNPNNQGLFMENSSAEVSGPLPLGRYKLLSLICDIIIVLLEAFEGCFEKNNQNFINLSQHLIDFVCLLSSTSLLDSIRNVSISSKLVLKSSKLFEILTEKTRNMCNNVNSRVNHSIKLSLEKVNKSE